MENDEAKKRDGERSISDVSKTIREKVMAEKIHDSASSKILFTHQQARTIEHRIINMEMKASNEELWGAGIHMKTGQGEGSGIGRGFKDRTVDRTPLLVKYFFGEGYSSQATAPGQEKLYPSGTVDEMPDWIKELVIKPVEDDGLVPRDWINSAVVNVYLPGGCFAPQIDPLQLFKRPIIACSFLSDTQLSFGCKFSNRSRRASLPVAQIPCKRGSVLSMAGYAADEVTHCIRPEDIKLRRAVIILRHVPENAPRMTQEELDDLIKDELNAKAEKAKEGSRSRSRSRSRRSRSRSRNRSRSRSRGRRRSRVDKMGTTWVRCSSSTRRRNRKMSPIPLRVPDPDPGDEDENEEANECEKGGYMGMFPNSRLAKRLAGKHKSSRVDNWCKQEPSEDDPKRLISRQRSESPGERGARNAARSKRSRSRSRGRQLEEVMRLQKRKEEVRERLEAVRLKTEVKEEPSGDISRTVEDIIKDEEYSNDEANAFRRKLKRMKAKLSKELDSGDDNVKNEDDEDPEDLEDGELDEDDSEEEEYHDSDDDVEKKELKSEVTDLKKELKELKALLKVSESSPEEDKEEDSELDSNDENVEDDPEDLEEDKLDLEQLKKMNAFELISKATKSTILSEKLKKPSQAVKDDESERIRRKLKERLRAKTPVLEEREGEQDSLRSKLLMKMRQQEERSKEEKPQSTKKKKIASKKIVEPKPSAIQSTSEEWTIKDRFEKVRKRLRNESSDDDSEEEKKKSKGNQFEAMKKKMEKKMKSKLKAEKGGGEKDKKDVEQYSMYSKRWRSEGQRKKAMEREEERWMQNLTKDNLKSSRNRSRSRSRSRGGRRSRSRERGGRRSGRRSRSDERRGYDRRDEVITELLASMYELKIIQGLEEK